jgi:hypothetical protein
MGVIVVMHFNIVHPVNPVHHSNHSFNYDCCDL